MATYNKRGYKTPKLKDDAAGYIEDVNVDEKDSTTAGVFSSLDETANKTEAWVEKNQKLIFSIVGVVALITVGWLLYQRFIAEPKENTAANDMFLAQENFRQALDGTKSDSLFNLALNGSEGQFGFIEIANEYPGTDAGNLANYYAGIAFLNTGKYAEATAALDKFKSDDIALSALAIGAKGDAYAQQNKMKEAFDAYVQASEKNKNDFTTPMYLLKAGKAALALGNKADALKYFTDIKDNYDAAPEAQGIDGLIGMAQ